MRCTGSGEDLLAAEGLAILRPLTIPLEWCRR